MTTVFHVWPYGGFIEIQRNLRKKKLHRTNQSSNFLTDSCSNRVPQSSLEEKVNPSTLKDEFSSRADPSIFTSVAPVLLEQSNSTSWVFPALKSTSHLLPSKFVNSRQMLTKTEVTVSRLELEGSTLLVVIVLLNYSTKPGSKWTSKATTTFIIFWDFLMF